MAEMMAATFFGWLLLSIALLLWQMRDGSFRVLSREPEMAFHSRPPLGFAVLMVGLPVLCLVGAFTPGAHTHNDQPVFILNAVLSVVIIVPLLVLLPLVQYVTLDKERLSYRLRTGGLLRPVVRSGPCSDLAGRVRARASREPLGLPGPAEQERWQRHAGRVRPP